MATWLGGILWKYSIQTDIPCGMRYVPAIARTVYIVVNSNIRYGPAVRYAVRAAAAMYVVLL